MDRWGRKIQLRDLERLVYQVRRVELVHVRIRCLHRWSMSRSWLATLDVHLAKLICQMVLRRRHARSSSHHRRRAHLWSSHLRVRNRLRTKGAICLLRLLGSSIGRICSKFVRLSCIGSLLLLRRRSGLLLVVLHGCGGERRGASADEGGRMRCGVGGTREGRSLRVGMRESSIALRVEGRLVITCLQLRAISTCSQSTIGLSSCPLCPCLGSSNVASISTGSGQDDPPPH